MNLSEIFSSIVFHYSRDEAGIWWFINCKAMKVNNVDKFIDNYGNVKFSPNLELFISKRREGGISGPVNLIDKCRKQGNSITRPK